MSLQQHTLPEQRQPGSTASVSVSACRAGLLLLVLTLAAGCKRVTATDSSVSVREDAGNTGGYVSAIPDGIPVTVSTPNGSTFDGFIDSLGSVIPAGVTFSGEVSDLYHGLFVMGHPGEYFVYTPLRPGQPLNSASFSDITDFRMGCAYGTRPGRDLMVIGRNGVVSRILSRRTRSVSLPPEGEDKVIVTTADIPLLARLNPETEEYFKMPESVGLTSYGRSDFWPTLDLAATGNGFYRVFRHSDQSLAGDFKIKPYQPGETFNTAYTGYIDPAEASSLIEGISTSGWESDSSFYSASTPGAVIAVKAGLSPLTVVYRFRLLDDKVVSLKQPDGTRWYFTFTGAPYIQAGLPGLMSWFTPPQPNPRSRLRAIIKPVTVAAEYRRQLMKAAERLALQRGFIGLADASHAFHGKGETYLYFVPGDRGFFIVMAFGQLDYPTVTGEAMNTGISYVNN